MGPAWTTSTATTPVTQPPQSSSSTSTLISPARAYMTSISPSNPTNSGSTRRMSKPSKRELVNSMTFSSASSQAAVKFSAMTTLSIWATKSMEKLNQPPIFPVLNTNSPVLLSPSHLSTNLLTFSITQTPLALHSQLPWIL